MTIMIQSTNVQYVETKIYILYVHTDAGKIWMRLNTKNI